MNEQETRESQLQGAAALVAGLHLSLAIIVTLLTNMSAPKTIRLNVCLFLSLYDCGNECMNG